MKTYAGFSTPLAKRRRAEVAPTGANVGGKRGTIPIWESSDALSCPKEQRDS